MLNQNRKLNLKKTFLQWEFFLVAVFIIINIVNASLSEYYLNLPTLVGVTQSFLDKAFIVLPMTFVLLMGEIDISPASTVALSSVVMAVSYNYWGAPMWLSIIICLLTGLLCGMFNGFILTRFRELPPMIVTLSTQLLFRGIALLILKDQSCGGFPEWFQFLGWGSVAGIPFVLLLFIACAVVFVLLLHKTNFGRYVYAIGSNRVASEFSGVNVNRTRFLVYSLVGLMSAVASLVLASRMDSTRPNVAMGYELDVIAMVVLGGVSSLGGKGRLAGPLIAIFIIGFLRYGLGLVNIQSEMLLIVLGCLLAVSVLIPNLKRNSQSAYNRTKNVKENVQ